MEALTARRAAGAAFALAAASMVATPLCRKGSRARAVLAASTVGGLAGTTLAASAQRWGTRRAVTALAVVAGATTAVEKIGTTTGVPFGRYTYTPRLRPQVGGVPVVVALAWFAMGVPAREVAPGRRWWWGAAALTAWDLFLDPQMTAEGYWRWTGTSRQPRYRGIPLSNYVGWLVTAAGIMALLDRLLPTTTTTGSGGDAGDPPPPDGTLVGTYAFMAVMSTLGFAVFFGDPFVAVVGGLGMLPFAVQGVRRWLAPSS